jgi:uncharacterized membrane protein HdeD (DUF308 family)
MRLRLAGILWVVAALLAIAVTFGFRVDQPQVVVTLAAGLIALALGALMLLRPTSPSIRLSRFVGAAWVALYLVLAVMQAGEIAAWTTDIFVGVFGAAAAFITSRAQGHMRSTPESS